MQMQKITSLAALGCLIGCGGAFSNKCEGTIFASVDSVLPIDCNEFDTNWRLAEQAVIENTSISPKMYENRMAYMHVHVRSVLEWHEGAINKEVSGYTQIDQIYLDAAGWALAHESLHAVDLMGFYDSLETDPMVYINEENHVGWNEKGYFNAVNQYITHYTKLNWPQ